jgi:hypothetical protein
MIVVDLLPWCGTGAYIVESIWGGTPLIILPASHYQSGDLSNTLQVKYFFGGWCEGKHSAGRARIDVGEVLYKYRTPP